MIDLTLPKGVRTLTSEEADRLDGYNPSIPTLPGGRNCITCKGEGIFLWWNDPRLRDEVVPYECPCTDQWILHRFLSYAHIGLRYQRLSWADMIWMDSHLIELADEYAANAANNVNNGVGLTLWGSAGNGKTSFVSIMLKWLMSKGNEGYFTTFNEMVSLFTATWRANPEEQRLFHRTIKNTAVLVVDDPGKETEGTKWSTPRVMFDEVIRHRVSNLKPTFIATNLSEAKFAERYGSFIVSLLSEVNVSVQVSGPDRRSEARARAIEDQSRGLIRPLVVK